jgi:hypothetical protein
MSWFGSKPTATTTPSLSDALKALPTIPSVDYNAAKFDASYVQQLQNQAAASLKATKEFAETQVKSVAGLTGTSQLYSWIIMFLGLGALVAVAILLYDTFAPNDWPNIFFDKGRGTTTSPVAPPSTNTPTLTILKAAYGVGNNVVDVTATLRGKIVGGTTLPGFIVGPGNVGLNENPVSGSTNTLYVTWYVGTSAYQQTTVDENTAFPSLPSSVPPSSPGPTPPGPPAPPVPSPPWAPPITTAPPPSLYTRLLSLLSGSDSSGDLMSRPHDATTTAIIQGSRAPLSAQQQGSYGMQWWMFVKDWNYGFGKDKAILKRPDPTNPSVMNPSVSLHPTDNSIRIAISVFSSEEGGTPGEPAPAGSSGQDDVFVCEVPNIPLQSWFSFSMSVFGRNLDVYIDGKLVKSCLLPGVPKPAISDIQLSPDGGFSGYLCNFYHFARMLTPADAMSFYSAGTSCRNSTPGTGSPSTATGYSVKFGVYDALGKQVQEYAF